MQYDKTMLKHGYNIVDGQHCFYDNRYDLLFSRDGRGRSYLVGKTAEWAKKKKREVIYECKDGTVVCKSNSSERNYIKKHYAKSKNLRDIELRLYTREVGDTIEEIEEEEFTTEVVGVPEGTDLATIRDIEFDSLVGWRVVNCCKCSAGVAIDPMADIEGIYCADCVVKELG